MKLEILSLIGNDYNMKKLFSSILVLCLLWSGNVTAFEAVNKTKKSTKVNKTNEVELKGFKLGMTKKEFKKNWKFQRKKHTLHY